MEYKASGATGYGVATLVEFLERIANTDPETFLPTSEVAP